MIDRTAETPLVYRIRTRDPAEVDLVVLHQTGPRFDPLRLKAHALVRADGEVVQLHPWLARMRYGSGPIGNSRGVNVEIEANLPGRYHRGEGRWAQEPRDVWDADARRAQVLAARALLAALKAELPALRYVCAHRTLQGGETSRRRAGCCGPDLWREVGEWAVAELGLELLPTAPGGLDLPDDWRRAPTHGVVDWRYGFPTNL